MTIMEQTKDFMREDINRLQKSLDQTITRLKNMRKYYEEVLEALG